MPEGRASGESVRGKYDSYFGPAGIQLDAKQFLQKSQPMRLNRSENGLEKSKRAEIVGSS